MLHLFDHSRRRMFTARVVLRVKDHVFLSRVLICTGERNLGIAPKVPTKPLVKLHRVGEEKRKTIFRLSPPR